MHIYRQQTVARGQSAKRLVALDSRDNSVKCASLFICPLLPSLPPSQLSQHSHFRYSPLRSGSLYETCCENKIETRVLTIKYYLYIVVFQSFDVRLVGEFCHLYKTQYIKTSRTVDSKNILEKAGGVCGRNVSEGHRSNMLLWS